MPNADWWAPQIVPARHPTTALGEHINGGPISRVMPPIGARAR